MKLISPVTSKVYAGLLVPIPTFDDVPRNTFEPLFDQEMNTRLLADTAVLLANNAILEVLACAVKMLFEVFDRAGKMALLVLLATLLPCIARFERLVIVGPVIDVEFMVPLTSSFVDGVKVPMPKLPAVVTVLLYQVQIVHMSYHQ